MKSYIAQYKSSNGELEIYHIDRFETTQNIRNLGQVSHVFGQPNSPYQTYSDPTVKVETTGYELDTTQFEVKKSVYFFTIDDCKLGSFVSCGGCYLSDVTTPDMFRGNDWHHIAKYKYTFRPDFINYGTGDLSQWEFGRVLLAMIRDEKLNKLLN